MRVRVIARLVASCASLLVVCVASGLAVAQPVPIAPQFGTPLGTPDPQKLQMPLRAPITLVPSITVSEEYNDNILLDNHNRQWDLITGITPGLNFIWESRTHHLIAAYNFTAELYLREPGRDNAFNHQNFTLDGMWRASERLTLTLTDGFTATTDTNLISPEGVSVGRNRSFGNVLAAGAAYQIDDFTSVRGGASYAVQRFENSALDDSNVYRVNVALDRALTRQLRGTVGYELGYFDIQHEDHVTTHTPRIGVSWQVTPTITLTVIGGPTFEEHQNGGSRVTPAVTAAYDQKMWFGAIGLGFDRQVATAGGLGGVTDNTSVYGRVDLLTLMRGLTLSFVPRYSWVKTPSGEPTRNGRIDIQSFTMPLQVTYRLTAWMAAVARYQFFRQRTPSEIRDNAGDLIATDADQNRLFVGLQFGYPITFDRP
jgi:hypothetical protein